MCSDVMLEYLLACASFQRLRHLSIEGVILKSQKILTRLIPPTVESLQFKGWSHLDLWQVERLFQGGDAATQARWGALKKVEIVECNVSQRRQGVYIASLQNMLGSKFVLAD